MRKAVICFSDEVNAAARLAARAKTLPGKTELWVLGGLGGFPAENTGADKIIEIEAAHKAVFAEPYACAQAIFALFGGETPDVLITPAGLRGDELAAQLALLTGGACMTAASELLGVDGGLAVRRSVYAGNLAADFSVQALPLAVSLLPGGEACNESAAAPERVTLVTEMNLPVWLTDAEYRETERTCSLSDAKVVVAAGRGAGGAAGIEKLNKLAKTLGGILGGSRPVICEGKLPPDRQLGLSGSRAAPELCLVFGASGAAAFRAGIESSRKIVAVNRDPQALIFEDCELGVVADCAEFADALAACLERAKNTPSAGVDPEGAV